MNVGVYGLLYEWEHKNVKNLLRNIKNANAYLFKNTKDTAPVGELGDENFVDYTANQVGESVNLDFAAIMANINTKQSPGKATRPSIHDENKNDGKKSSGKEKSPGKSGKSKGRAATNSPNKKGGKKKK